MTKNMSAHSDGWSCGYVDTWADAVVQAALGYSHVLFSSILAVTWTAWWLVLRVLLAHIPTIRDIARPCFTA